MRILNYFKRRGKLREELEEKVRKGDYDSVKNILIKEINARNYDSVGFRVLQLNLPKEHFEELLKVVNNAKPPLLQKMTTYLSLKGTLKGRIKDFK